MRSYSKKIIYIFVVIIFLMSYMISFAEEGLNENNMQKIDLKNDNDTKKESYLNESVENADVKKEVEKKNNENKDQIQSNNRTIEDGVYVIRSAINTRYVLDVNGTFK